MEPTAELLQEVFKQTTITEVVVEVRFDPILRIDRDIALFQDYIRAQFPVYAEDNINNQTAHAFMNSDETTKIRITPDKFNLVTRDYSCFSDYMGIWKPALEQFISLYDIGPIKRVGLRYINQIPFKKEKRPVDIFQNYIDLPIDSSRYEDVDIDGFKLELVMNNESVHIASRHGLLELNEEEPHARFIYILDIDCFSEVAVDASSANVEALISKLHIHEKREFIRSIKPGYIEWMRGESKDAS